MLRHVDGATGDIEALDHDRLAGRLVRCKLCGNKLVDLQQRIQRFGSVMTRETGNGREGLHKPPETENSSDGELAQTYARRRL